MLGRGIALTSVLALGVAAPAMAQDVPEDKVVQLSSFDISQYKNGFTANELQGSTAYDRGGQDMGTVQSVIIGPNDMIQKVVIETGGALEIGDKVIAVPWNEVDPTPGQAGIKVDREADNLESFSLFNDREQVATGPRAFRASELIGDYVQLKDNVNYGWVRDLAFAPDGKLQAVVAEEDVAYGGAGGTYAYPYYGYGYGYDPGLDSYGLPYERGELTDYQPFDYDMYYDDEV